MKWKGLLCLLAMISPQSGQEYLKTCYLNQFIIGLGSILFASPCIKWLNSFPENMVKRLLCGVFLCSFGILGIIGNILSIIVFTRSMKSVNNMIVCGKSNNKNLNFEIEILNFLPWCNLTKGIYNRLAQVTRRDWYLSIISLPCQISFWA